MSRVSPSLALGAIVILAPSAVVSTLTSILSLAPINLISVLFSPPSLISVLVPISLLTVNPPCSFVIFSLLVVWSVLSSSTRFFTLLSCATLTASVSSVPVSYTHLRAHETRHDLVCRLLLEKKKKNKKRKKISTW